MLVTMRQASPVGLAFQMLNSTWDWVESVQGTAEEKPLIDEDVD